MKFDKIKRKYNKFIRTKFTFPVAVLEGFTKICVPFKTNNVGSIYVPKEFVGSTFQLVLIPRPDLEEGSKKDESKYEEVAVV